MLWKQESTKHELLGRSRLYLCGAWAEHLNLITVLQGSWETYLGGPFTRIRGSEQLPAGVSGFNGLISCITLHASPYHMIFTVWLLFRTKSCSNISSPWEDCCRAFGSSHWKHWGSLISSGHTWVVGTSALGRSFWVDKCHHKYVSAEEMCGSAFWNRNHFKMGMLKKIEKSYIA